jgi:hypothetical protein
VIDQAGNQWTLPTVVTIPSAGSITVTITCTVEGTITAATGTITQIGNYTPGWQSFTNTSAAVPGDPVEQDGQLRQRQSQSTSLAAITPRQAIQANIANVAGVTYVNVYENDTQAADVHGVPPHAIAAVVAGGAVKDIATAIAYKKSPGTGSYGTTNYIVIDSQGVPDTINFFVLTYTQIYYKITIEPLTGFVSTTETLIQDAINQYINTLPDSTTLYVNRLNAPANLSGTAAQIATSLSQTQLDAMSATYDVVSITIGLTNSALGTSNIIIPFGTSPQTSTTNGSVVTVP